VLDEISQKLNDKYHMFLTLYVEVKNGGWTECEIINNRCWERISRGQIKGDWIVSMHVVGMCGNITQNLIYLIIDTC
jgi:hypothetical protein